MIDTAIIRQRILDKLLYEDINNDVEELKWSAVSKNIQYGISEKITNNGPLRVVRITDLAERKINWNTVPFHTLQKGCLEHYLLKDGDILFARSGATVGKSVLVKDPPDNTIFAGYLIRSTPDQSVVLPVYASYYFQTSIFWSQLSEGVTSTAQPNFNGKKLGNLKLRVPPLEEQKRIVAKIEGLFAKIDEIDKAQKELKELAELAEKKVLDMAVRGELVEQDETKVKKVLVNDHYMILPNSWNVMKGKKIFKKMTNVVYRAEDSITYIDIGSIDNNLNVISSPKQLKANEAPSRAKRFIEYGDVLFSMVRPYLRNIAKVQTKFLNPVASTGFYVMSPIDEKTLSSDFVLYVCLSPLVINGLNEKMKGDNSPSIRASDIENFDYPIPPIETQKRISEIVCKVRKKLFAIL